MSKGIMKMIGCGGAGIHIVNEVGGLLDSLGDGFSKIDRHYIDTSTDIDHDEDIKDKFFIIKTKTHSGSTIDGSGGERQTNQAAIIPGVKDFLDSRKMVSPETGVFHIVCFAASSGSGSVIAPVIIMDLLKRNMPVVAVIIGDSTNGLCGINTYNTLRGLHQMSVKLGKPLSTMYVNNQSYMDNGAGKAIENANKSIFNSLSSLSIFLSGENHSIDNQDMINIIDQSRYNTIDIKPGLVALNTYSKEVIVPDGCVPTVGRTLTANGVSPDINVHLWHNKVGRIVHENAIDKYDGLLPLHLVSFTNFFTLEIERLKKYSDSVKQSMASVEVPVIPNDVNNDIDENGLVF